VNFKTSRIKSALVKKGFVETSGANHDKYIYYTQEGKKTSVFTFFSRGSSLKEYGESLLGPMRLQLKINKDQFSGLINCPLSQNNYEDILKSQGIV